MSLFEAIMLICFGSAWPFAIYKTYRTKTVDGKSIYFLIILLCGYMSGIIHKFLYSQDLVIILYCLNFLMVGIETILYVKYKTNID
jgi:hypothetical protein